MTIEYYNLFAADFIKGTIDADLSVIRGRFLKYLQRGDHILDFGCGSGRDAKVFLEKGYQITATDGSSACCKLAANYMGQEVLCRTFKQLSFVQEFDGVWASASLLHVPFDEITEIFLLIDQALKPGGVLYASFKYGDFEGERNGRYFTDLTEERLRTLLKPINRLETIETFVTDDVRKGHEGVKWLNVIVQKKK
jgi:SAM-dependent methyltransferase